MEIKEDSPGAWMNLGIAYFESGQIPAAQSTFDRLLRMKPAPPLERHIWFSAGRIKEAQGRKDEAIGHYRTALSLGEESGLTHAAIGSVLLGLGEFEKATEELDLALMGQTDPMISYRELLDRMRQEDGLPEEMSWADAEAGGETIGVRLGSAQTNEVYAKAAVDTIRNGSAWFHYTWMPGGVIF